MVHEAEFFLKQGKSFAFYIDIEGAKTKIRPRPKNKKIQHIPAAPEMSLATELLATFRQLLGSCKYPVATFASNALKENRGHYEGVIENSRISLLPDLPSDEDDCSLEPFPGGGRSGGQVLPVLKNCGFCDPQALH